MTTAAFLALLLACTAGSSGDSGWDASGDSSSSGGPAVYEADCETARLDGVEVPGISGAAVYQAEACGGASCRPAYDSARRDGEVLRVSCDAGEETVRIVLLR